MHDGFRLSDPKANVRARAAALPPWGLAALIRRGRRGPPEPCSLRRAGPRAAQMIPGRARRQKTPKPLSWSPCGARTLTTK
jgi:hypothetical protein